MSTAYETMLDKAKIKWIEEGKKEGFLEALVGLVKDNMLTIVEAAKRAQMTVAEFEAKTGLKSSDCETNE